MVFRVNISTCLCKENLAYYDGQDKEKTFLLNWKKIVLTHYEMINYIFSCNNCSKLLSIILYIPMDISNIHIFIHITFSLTWCTTGWRIWFSFSSTTFVLILIVSSIHHAAKFYIVELAVSGFVKLCKGRGNLFWNRIFHIFIEKKWKLPTECLSIFSWPFSGQIYVSFIEIFSFRAVWLLITYKWSI